MNILRDWLNRVYIYADDETISSNLFRGDLQPAAWCRAEVDYDITWPENMVGFVELQKFIGGPASIAFLLS